jgi:hypothetical protein
MLKVFNVKNDYIFKIPDYALDTPINIMSSSGQYLSCAEFDNVVDFFTGDGIRQRWILEKDPFNDQVFYIKSAFLRYNHTQYLGCPNQNNQVYLYTSKNKYTKWSIENIIDNTYMIQYTGIKFNKNLTELVVARYNENINWVSAYNDIATVYNKGEDDILNIKKVVKIPNVGREGNTYLYHIINNYGSLKEKTVFSQGNPFDHNETFLFGIDNIEKTREVQPLGLRWLESKSIPPSEYIEQYKTVTNYGLIYLIASCDANLIIPYFDDDGINELNINARIEYPQYNSVDLVPGFLHRAKFPYWKGNTSISFTYSALFSADKRKILKLDKQVYINLSDELTSLYDHGGTNGYVLERLWLYILDGF